MKRDLLIAAAATELVLAQGDSLPAARLWVDDPQVRKLVIRNEPFLRGYVGCRRAEPRRTSRVTVAARFSLLYCRCQAIDQGAEMRTAFMSIEKGFSTYSEGMTLAATNAELGDPGARRRR
jgi:hypothetical protein